MAIELSGKASTGQADRRQTRCFVGTFRIVRRRKIKPAKWNPAWDGVRGLVKTPTVLARLNEPTATRPSRFGLRLRPKGEPVLRFVFIAVCLYVSCKSFAQSKESEPQPAATGDDNSLSTVETTFESVTGFRPGHNLSLFGSWSQFAWKVKKAGEVQSLNATQSVPTLSLRYTYHVNLFRNSGMVFGTTFATHIGNQTNQGFRPGVGIQLPSLAFGLTQNVLSTWRFTALAEYSATWFPWMTARGVDSRVELASLPDTLTLTGQIDYFVSLSSALSIESGFGQVGSAIVAKPSNNTVAATTDFRASRWFVGLGWTVSLGDLK